MSHIIKASTSVEGTLSRLSTDTRTIAVELILKNLTLLSIGHTISYKIVELQT